MQRPKRWNWLMLIALLPSFAASGLSVWAGRGNVHAQQRLMQQLQGNQHASAVARFDQRAAREVEQAELTRGAMLGQELKRLTARQSALTAAILHGGDADQADLQAAAQSNQAAFAAKVTACGASQRAFAADHARVVQCDAAVSRLGVQQNGLFKQILALDANTGWRRWATRYSSVGILPYVVCVIWLASIQRRRLLRQRKGQCLTCGYDLHGNVSGICPECGSPATVAAA